MTDRLGALLGPVVEALHAGTMDRRTRTSPAPPRLLLRPGRLDRDG